MEEEEGYLEGQTDPQLKLLNSYAINLSVIRMREKGEATEAIESNICQGSLVGLGKDTSLGQTIYAQHVLDNTGLNTVAGLADGGTFSQIESGVGASYFSTWGATANSLYESYTTAALMGGWVVGVDSSKLNSYLSGAYQHFNSYLSDGPSGNVFTNAELGGIQSAYNYEQSLGEIFDASQKNASTNKIFFKYFDLNDSFTDNVDVQLVKDSAIQEYEISGDIAYSALEWSALPKCTEVEIPIFVNENNEMVQRHIYLGPQSFPCIDEHTEIQPVTGVEFYRKVVDGPYSSGVWTQDIMDRYIDREKSGLAPKQYEENRDFLTTYDGIRLYPVSGNETWINTNLPEGEYRRPFAREKNDSPKNGQTTLHHVGNATGVRTGSYISGYYRRTDVELNPLFDDLIQIYRLSGLNDSSTGIKFVPLKLKKENWQDKFQNNVYNPSLPDDRVYDIALNLNTGHNMDLNDYRIKSGIAGPPQRDDLSDLPYMVFYQDFDSETEDTYGQVTLGFGMSASERHEVQAAGHTRWKFTQFMLATTGSGGFSPTFKDENHYRAEELNQSKTLFAHSVGSPELENTGHHDRLIKHHFFGMGNNIDGGTTYGYRVTNGGFDHQGYRFSGVTGIDSNNMNSGRGEMDNMVLLSGYSGYPLTRISHDFDPPGCIYRKPSDYGSLYSKGCVDGSNQLYDTYLVGWKHPSYGSVKVSQMYAYISGTAEDDGIYDEEFTYSGLNNTNTAKASAQFPEIDIQTHGFAANPFYTGLMSSGWVPVTKKQRRDNALQRYWRGPFASARKKFLYTNAHDLVTGSSLFGAVTGTDLLTELNEGGSQYHNSTGGHLPIGEYGKEGFRLNVGFPHVVKYDMVVTEYATKEYYKKTDWNSFGNPVKSNMPGVDPVREKITWKAENEVFQNTVVDGQYAPPNTFASNIHHMGHTGKNPLIYNSPPNYIHGLMQDDVGYLSGTDIENATPGWDARLMHDSGAYLVKWRDTLNGSSYGDPKTKNPEGNYFQYKTYTRTISGIYTPPGYRMSDSTYHPEYMWRLLPSGRDDIKGLGDSTYSPPLFGFPGGDPLWHHRVSSITGVTGVEVNEEVHGGMHPENLHGDAWMNFSYSGVDLTFPGYAYGDEDEIRSYGFGVQEQDSNPHTYYHRQPARDNLVFLTDLRSTGFGLHFTAANFFPGSGRGNTGDFSNRFNHFRTGMYTGFAPGKKFDLASQTFSFIGEVETGIVYPAPSGNHWEGSGSGSNTIWPDVEQWQRDHTGTAYTWRKASKMDVSFQNVTWTGYGQLPYDTEYLYMPSGSANINGHWKYNHLREAPVFSEGVFLADVSKDDPILTYGSYPQFLSATLQDHGEEVTIPINSSLNGAPSRQLELKDAEARIIAGDGDFRKINTIERDFNKYIVMATSDYNHLNGGVLPSYEGTPLPDDLVYPNATMLFSANKGQEFPDNSTNPYVTKEYEVQKQHQYYDGELTDATLDDRFKTEVYPIWGYEEPENGEFVPAGITLREAQKNLY